MIKNLHDDPDGMVTYEWIVNHVAECNDHREELIENLKRVDSSGQFMASTARFLTAIDAEAFADWITPLVEGAIDKDRERRYIGSLLEAIWGPDYMERADELREQDDNFRRVYKRVYASPLKI